MIVGLLHPGEMGAAIGAALRGRGHGVLWASDGRSDATRRRADDAGLSDAHTAAELTAQSDVVISIVPPHAALTLAESMPSFDGIFVDANAIAPETARRVGAHMRRFVDGGIVGPPPAPGSPTRLYLSGAEAAAVAELFDGTPVEARIVSNASAVKVAYAAWTKGTAALLLAIRRFAVAEGVEAALLEEWRRSQPGLSERQASAERSAEAKGWRWVGEMEEIAAAFAVHGLPAGFHDAAAEIFRAGGAEGSSGRAGGAEGRSAAARPSGSHGGS